jgi:hypothetical protein
MHSTPVRALSAPHSGTPQSPSHSSTDHLHAPTAYPAGLVVAVSLAELIIVATGGGKTGTQALRTLRVLRLLRTLKLLHRIRALRDLTQMALRGLYSLRDFILLLVLFLFIFAVIGRQQFAGLWSFTPEANPNWPSKSRSNFNTLWQVRPLEPRHTTQMSYA